MSNFLDTAPVGRVASNFVFDSSLAKARSDRTITGEDRYTGSTSENHVGIYPGDLCFCLPSDIRGLNEPKYAKIFSNFVGLTVEEAKRAIFMGIAIGSGKTPSKEGKFQEPMIALAHGGMITLPVGGDHGFAPGTHVMYEIPKKDEPAKDGRFLAKLKSFDHAKHSFDEEDFIEFLSKADKNTRVIKEMDNIKDLVEDKDSKRMLAIYRVWETRKYQSKRRVIGMVTNGGNKGGNFDMVFGFYAC